MLVIACALQAYCPVADDERAGYPGGGHVNQPVHPITLEVADVRLNRDSKPGSRRGLINQIPADSFAVDTILDLTPDTQVRLFLEEKPLLSISNIGEFLSPP